MIRCAPSAPTKVSRSGALRRGCIRLAGLLYAASLYSSAGSVELPVDNTVFLVQQAAREHLARQAASAGLLEPLFEINVVKTTRPIEPCGAKVTVEPVDARQPNRMRFVAICPGAGGWRYEFVARASLSARVAVMALPLAAGKPLAEADVVLERRDISNIADSIWDPRPLVGMASRRTLRAGEILRQSFMAQPAVVKRGELVRIVARRDQVEVSMAGEALDAGAVAALVRVRNTTSGSVIRARVTGAGTVEPAEIPGGAP